MITFQKYRPLKSKIIDSLKISTFITSVFYFLNSLSIELLIILFLFLFILNLILSGPGGTITLFDGWNLSESSLTISKDTIFGYKEITINLNEIDKIIYSESGYRKPPYLIIHYKGNKVFLYVSYSIYGFADTLKFLKKSGINVSLSKQDVEIEMYLNDKVDKIPITNE